MLLRGRRTWQLLVVSLVCGVGLSWAAGQISGTTMLPEPPARPRFVSPTVWIVSGQSNVVGYATGAPSEPVAHAEQWNISTRSWEPLRDPPSFGVTPIYILPNRVSPWPAAAREALALGVVKHLRIGGWAEGGLSIDQWSERGRAWQQLSEAIRSARRVDAFVWFQGETDADRRHYRAAGRYADRLRNLLHRVRALVRNPQLRVVICSVGPPGPKLNTASLRTIRDAQRAVAESEALGTFVDTTVFEHNGQHLTASGYDELGKVIARVLSN